MNRRALLSQPDTTLLRTHKYPSTRLCYNSVPRKVVHRGSLVTTPQATAAATSSVDKGNLPAVLQPIGKAIGNIAYKLQETVESWNRIVSAIVVTQLLQVKTYGDVDIVTLTSTSPVLVVSNHQSSLDFAVLSSVLGTLGVQKVLLVSGDEGISVPTTHAHHIILPRTRRKGFLAADIEHIRSEVAKYQGEKIAVVVFPERTISESGGSIRYFKLSVAYLASKLQFPVVPVFLSGTHTALPRHYHVPLPGQVAVELGMFLPPPADTATDADKELGDGELLVSRKRREGLMAFDARLKEVLTTLRSSVRAKKRVKWQQKNEKDLGRWGALASKAVPLVVYPLMYLLRFIDTGVVQVLQLLGGLLGKAFQGAGGESLGGGSKAQEDGEGGAVGIGSYEDDVKSRKGDK